MFTEHTVQAGAVSLNYAEGGDGPPIVLLHGATDSWRRFLPVLPALAVRWRVYALDLRGHGGSSRVPGGYHRSGYAADTGAFVRGLGDPVAVIGHSLGGLVGIEVALAMPDVVRALVLEDPPLYPHQPGPGTERSPYTRFALIKELASAGMPVDAITRRLLERNPRGNPDSLRLRAEVIAQLDPEVLRDPGGGRRSLNADIDQLLRKLTRPVLLLRADPERGGVVSAADQARFTAAMPTANLVHFPGVGHDIARGGADAYVRAVVEFLA